MPQFKKILAALCLSEHSVAVLEHAVILAKKFDADLILANVVNVRDISDIGTIQAMGYDMSSDEYRRGLKEDRREKIADLLKGVQFPKERMQTIVAVGHPVQRLLEMITDEKADLLVIGAKGRTNLPQLLVGSVAEKLFRHSPITVVSVRTD